MTTRKSKLFLKPFALLSFLFVALTMRAQPVPTDENVRVGKLENGLTYYIRYNNWPEDRADFYIAQRVGSINEEENQRGLAHFLEHLCFNGTKHFKGNEIISYCESLGVKFGTDLNAYTSTDETVYRICNVPTDRQSALDSCLLILHDWSHDILLEDNEIDKERGVIKGEWRMRSGAAYRMLERCAPKIFVGSRYGQRMPIGLMSVVENFAYDDLRAYYRKWYYPANQAIVVVGNVDIDYTEELIKKLFSAIATPSNAGVVEKYDVPDNEKIICAVESDPEQSGQSLTIYFKHDGLTDEEIPTEAFFRNDYVSSVVRMMLNDRLSEIARKATSPFTAASFHNGNFSISKAKEAFSLQAVVKKDSLPSATRTLAEVITRVLQHGFTPTEYARAAKRARALIDDYFANSDRRENNAFAQEYIRNFLEGEPIPSTNDYMAIIKRVEQATTLADANQYVAKNVAADNRNVVITAFCQSAGNEPLPTEQSLISAFEAGRAVETQPYIDDEVQGSLLRQDPVAGKIVKEESLEKFDAKVWTLSNGAKVYLRHSEVKPNEIRLAATSPGGYSQHYSRERASTLRMMSELIGASGWGDYTKEQLKKLLVGTKVSVTPFINLTEEGLNGSTTPEDLATALQLIHLKLTSISADREAFANLIEATRNRIENQAANPKQEMADSIFRYVYSHHPLAAKITAAELSEVNYDDALEIFRNRFADVSDFAFYITGNFDEQQLRPLVETYLASLPSLARKEKAVDVGYHLATKRTHVEFSRAMENPQSVVYVYRDGEVEYTPRNVILANLLGSMMSNIYRREIREEKGWAYSIRTHCSIVAEVNGGDKPHFNFPLNCPIQPGNEKECLEIVNQRLQELAVNGVDAEELANVKRYMMKSARESFEDNGYWAVTMKQYHKYGLDFYNGYLDLIESITPDDMKQFIANVVLKGNQFELIMTPSNK